MFDSCRPSLLVTLATVSVALLSGAAAPAHAAPRACLEDMPCWRWPEQGNRARGLTLTDGRFVVFGTCHYSRAWRAGRVDRALTPVLPGDHWARAHGCDR